MCADDPPPDVCLDEDFDVENVDPAFLSVTGLYERSLYCNECFLKVWRQRLLSPFLTSGNWTKFRIDQFESLQKDCSTSMPYITSKPTLFVGEATLKPTPTPTTSGAITTGVAATVTCTGRVIRPSVTPQYCNKLVDMYKVSSGDLKIITKNEGCEFTGAICIPLPCVSLINHTMYDILTTLYSCSM
jgi:hypothetical protein